MKSVLYVTTTFPTMAFFLENEVRWLHERGVRVRVVTLRRKARRYHSEHEVIAGLTSEVGSPFDPRGWALLLLWTLRRPHVMIPGVLRMLWASRASLYALAGHLMYLPAVGRVATLAESGDFDRVHGAWAHFPASVAWLAARLAGRRFSMAGHAGSDLHRTQAFLRRKVRDADFVLTCVDSNAAMLRRLCGDDARVFCIYHGIDRRRFDGTERTPAPEPLLLAVGRLADTKGFDIAVRGLGVMAERGLRPRLVFLGDGPNEAALRQLAVDCGVADQVEFRGMVAQTDVLQLYREAWLLLSPSRVLANRRVDGIPNVIVEALAMGLPCAGTRVGGIEEILVDGVNGALFATDDPAALASAVEPLLRDRALLERLGAGARACIAERFDARRNFERVCALMMADRAEAPTF